MGKGRKLTDFDCGKIYVYREESYSIREITDKLGRMLMARTLISERS